MAVRKQNELIFPESLADEIERLAAQDFAPCIPAAQQRLAALLKGYQTQAAAQAQEEQANTITTRKATWDAIGTMGVMFAVVGVAVKEPEAIKVGIAMTAGTIRSYVTANTYPASQPTETPEVKYLQDSLAVLSARKEEMGII
jgi:hypothetical protein